VQTQLEEALREQSSLPSTPKAEEKAEEPEPAAPLEDNDSARQSKRMKTTKKPASDSNDMNDMNDMNDTKEKKPRRSGGKKGLRRSRLRIAFTERMVAWVKEHWDHPYASSEPRKTPPLVRTAMGESVHAVLNKMASGPDYEYKEKQVTNWLTNYRYVSGCTHT
jgi:hypothetical protein